MIPTVHETWCALNPENGYGPDFAGQYCECEQVPLSAVLAEVRALNTKFDRVADQVAGVVEQAGPVIEKLAASPMVRMLTGGGKRDK